MSRGTGRILLIPLLFIGFIISGCITDCVEEKHTTIVDLILPDTVEYFVPFEIEAEVFFASGHYSWNRFDWDQTHEGYTCKAIADYEGCKTAHCATWTMWKTDKVFPIKRGILIIECVNPRTASIIDSVFVR